MKLINSLFLTITFLSVTSIGLFAHGAKDAKAVGVDSKIDTYLTSIDYHNTKETATIFVNFIVAENDNLYTVDFMVTENDEVIVLSKTEEDEFYRVDKYNANFMSQYSVPVSSIM